MVNLPYLIVIRGFYVISFMFCFQEGITLFIIYVIFIKKNINFIGFLMIWSNFVIFGVAVELLFCQFLILFYFKLVFHVF
jgi:hypothetical protein